ncbi:hypothetical protein FQ330_12735 [Agrococcus sediminis]|uniref:Uncharacterized protein n=1 Tax=Agrococcus sediminis TaxID=2599924 RepID=A0A5M8Q645_9MICO|nr:hypothetical protein [Agrococcus sediminis]KAA6430578.1 hypothetical protein FQ330_12735 [Agrococcus sediminis]RWR24303.1 hypothetical protein D8Y24_05750 [Agrococcus lahaulensis]
MPKQIPEETKQRAIRLVLDHLDEYPPTLVAAVEPGEAWPGPPATSWFRPGLGLFAVEWLFAAGARQHAVVIGHGWRLPRRTRGVHPEGLPSRA